MILVNLSNDSHYFFHFIVRSNHFYHFHWWNLSLMNLISVKFSFAKVAVGIHWLIDALKVGNVNLRVHFIENYWVLLVINSCDVNSQRIVFTTFLTWEGFEHIAFFTFGNDCSTFIYNFTEFLEINLTFVILISVILNRLNKFQPFGSKLLENFSVNLNSFILMHFLVKNAEVLVIFGGLPALFMITNINFLSLGFILSKIQSFCREHFSSNRNLKIFIGNNTITIDIKFIENMIKFIFSNFKTPKIKIKLKLSSTNFTSFFYIEIHECFSESFPLEHNFF